MVSNECAVSIQHFAAHTGIVHGRDAEPRTCQRRAPKPFANLQLAGRRNLARHQSLRAIDQHPRGCTGRVPQNFAARFAQPACPSTRVRYTGLSGAAAEISSAVGNCFPVQLFWSHECPRIHSLGLCSCTALRTIPAISSTDLVPRRSSVSKLSPSASICPCESINPGIIVPPRASI